MRPISKLKTDSKIKMTSKMKMTSEIKITIKSEDNLKRQKRQLAHSWNPHSLGHIQLLIICPISPLLVIR